MAWVVGTRPYLSPWLVTCNLACRGTLRYWGIAVDLPQPAYYTDVLVTYQEQSSYLTQPPRSLKAMTRSANSTHSSAWHGVDRSNRLAANASLSCDRRGRLKNGNRPGDFLAAPRCVAHTRCGGECRQPAMPNGRCRLHGGLSTGPRTPAGLARSRRARWKHGARSAQVRALLREARLQARRTRALRARLDGSSAGHGLIAQIPHCPRVSSPFRRSTTENAEVTEKRIRLPRAQRAFALPLCPLCPPWSNLLPLGMGFIARFAIACAHRPRSAAPTLC